MGRLIDLTGKHFEHLFVIERAGSYIPPSKKSATATWRCQCDCGSEVIVIGNNLRSGATTSCGCIRTEKAAERLEGIRNRRRKNE